MDYMGIRQAILIGALAVSALGQDIAAKADAFVKAYEVQKKFTGSVLIAQGGKVVFEKGYSLANREWQIPNTPETVFRLGSITKQFTAAAILKLEAAGKLKTTDKACDYLPDCPEAWRPITIHQLATHTSGVPNFTALPEYRNIKYAPSRYEDQVKLVWRMPMNFDPGTKMEYSNTGYLMLGKIIEKASGLTWDRYLQQEIFAPLGMTHTQAEPINAIVPRRAAGYSGIEGTVRNADFIDMRIPGGAGALVSTVQDLYLWDRALAAGKIVPDALKQRMFTPEKNNYAYGWTVRDVEGKKIAGHSGGIDGFSTQLQRIEQDGILVIALANADDAKTGEVASGLLALAQGKAVEPPKQRAEIELDEATLDQYVGRYEFQPQFSLVISREGKSLITQATNQGKVPIFAEAKDVFFPKLMPATLRFQRENGRVTGVVLQQGGREMKAPKVE